MTETIPLENVGKRTVVGAAWMMFSKLSVRFIGLISTLILVRLLDPIDFGITAMAMTVVASVELLTAFGFDVALIQNQNADRDDYNTAWSLNVSLGLAAGALLLCFAYPAAVFYERPELVAVYATLSLASIFQGLENIGVVDFRKDLNFDKEFAFRVSIKITAFFVTIGLALWLRSYWALVGGIIVSRLAATIISYWVHDFRPRWSFAAISRIMNFSKWLFFNNMLNLARRVGPDFIIGKVSGARSLGLYAIAFEISNLPTTELVAPANRALLPGFSKIAGDPKRASRAFVRVTAILSLLSMPVGFGIAATADLFTPIILGQNWLAAIPLIKVLALYGSIMAIQSPIAMVLIALGKPRFVTLMSLAQLTFMLPLLIYMNSTKGLEGATLAMLATACLSLPAYFILAAHQMTLPASAFLRVIGRPLLSALIMFWVVREFVSSLDAKFADLILASSAGAMVFTTAMFVLWLVSGRPEKSAEKEVFNVCRSYADKMLTKITGKRN